MVACAAPSRHPKVAERWSGIVPGRDARSIVLPALLGDPEEDRMAKRGPDLVDPRLAKALEHPIRTDILTILRDGPSSPARIGRQLEDVSLNLIAHHMKVLEELGCIELAETVSRRGAIEHVYRGVGPFVVSDEEWARATPKARQPITAQILRRISDDLARSIEGGRFEELDDNHLSRTPLNLDRQGWSETCAILMRALEEVMEVGHESRKRLEEGGEEPLKATVAILQFPTD